MDKTKRKRIQYSNQHSLLLTDLFHLQHPIRGAGIRASHQYSDSPPTPPTITLSKFPFIHFSIKSMTTAITFNSVSVQNNIIHKTYTQWWHPGQAKLNNSIRVSNPMIRILETWTTSWWETRTGPFRNIVDRLVVKRECDKEEEGSVGGGRRLRCLK